MLFNAIERLMFATLPGEHENIHAFCQSLKFLRADLISIHADRNFRTQILQHLSSTTSRLLRQCINSDCFSFQIAKCVPLIVNTLRVHNFSWRINAQVPTE